MSNTLKNKSHSLLWLLKIPAGYKLKKAT